MKRYEGLFILNNTAREEGIKETIDKISAEIVATGGKVETVQKMEKRHFTRIADKKYTAGFYVNVIFQGKPESIVPLRKHLALNEDIFRVLFSIAAPPVPVGAPVPA